LSGRTCGGSTPSKGRVTPTETGINIAAEIQYEIPEFSLPGIRGSPVVRSGPGPDEESIREFILFYTLDEIQCPHGRPSKGSIKAC
jgi:hypothetical protein